MEDRSQGPRLDANDFDAGRKTEVDISTARVVRLAERLGRTAPVNAAIVALVKEAEAGGPAAVERRRLCKHVFA